MRARPDQEPEEALRGISHFIDFDTFAFVSF